VSEWVNGYLRAVRSADEAVDTLLRIVLGRGELHHTVFVVTAEQGASLGEAGVWFDRVASLPDAVLVTPWIVAGPGVRRHAVVVGPSSLVDVTPTILGLIGLGGARVSEGEDLSRRLGADAAERDPQSGPVFAEAPPDSASDVLKARAVWFGRWKLVRFAGGREEFFVVEEGGGETPAPHRPGDRQQDRLSNMLTRRASEESGLVGGPGF
jgi:arylsulfatase A-like enzyme